MHGLHRCEKMLHFNPEPSSQDTAMALHSEALGRGCRVIILGLFELSTVKLFLSKEIQFFLKCRRLGSLNTNVYFAKLSCTFIYFFCSIILVLGIGLLVDVFITWVMLVMLLGN